MFIYMIVCSETLKIYIGQHKGNNLQKYLQTKFSDAKANRNQNSHLFNAMRKHSREFWSIHPLVSGVETREELDELEKHFIRILKTQHPDVGYNICAGGEGFTGPHTQQSRQKMSKSQKLDKNSPENRQLTSARFKQMWSNPNKKQEISDAIKAAPSKTRFVKGIVPWNVGTKGVMQANSGSFKLGHPKPEDSGAKGPNKTSFVRGHKRNVGKKLTPEHRLALSLSHKGIPNPSRGKKRSETAKQKMRDAWKIRKLAKNKTFSSIDEATNG